MVIIQWSLFTYFCSIDIIYTVEYNKHTLFQNIGDQKLIKLQATGELSEMG